MNRQIVESIVHRLMQPHLKDETGRDSSTVALVLHQVIERDGLCILSDEGLNALLSELQKVNQYVETPIAPFLVFEGGMK